MPQRPIRSLAVIGVLALGDYMLWNWSVGANHDVIALVAGVTLIPLLIAFTWLVVVAVARLLAHAAQRPRARGASARAAGAGRDVRAGGRPRGSRVEWLHRGTSGARAVATTGAPTTSAAEPPTALGDPTPATTAAAGNCRLPVFEARRVKRRWIALTALLVLAGMALGGYVYARNRTGSIYHPHARFVPQANPTLPKRGPERFSWPLYGYTKNHARYYPAPASLRPPFRKVWAVGGSSLREFPPVLSENRIFQLTDNGVLTASTSGTARSSGAAAWAPSPPPPPPSAATRCMRRCSPARPDPKKGASSRST